VTLAPDRAEILRSLQLLVAPGEIFEVRAIKTKKATVSGYFDDLERAADLAFDLGDDPHVSAPAVYVTLNPCLPPLLSRAVNQLKPFAQVTTQDGEIVRRIWLLLDFDPVRPAGISSTDQEHELALARAEACREYLSTQGWPEPVSADSGNGGHLLYRIDLPNDAASTELVKRVLQALAAKFDDASVTLDQSVFNASRICKLYGTPCRKGDSTPERPHRLAAIQWNGQATFEVVSREQLEAIADQATPDSNSQPESQSDVITEVLKRLQVIENGPYKNGTRYIVTCPYGSEHDAGVFVFPNSPIGFDCLHTGCPGHGKSGKDLLALLGLTERALILGPHGAIKPILANAVTWLATDPIFSGVLAFNEFTKRTITKNAAPWPQSTPGEEWSDFDDIACAIYLQHHGILAGPNIAAEAVQHIARRFSFHPVKDFLLGLQWDQVPRVDTWLTEYLGAVDSAFIRAAGAAWLISACARIFQPGCKADYCLTLIGDQGLRKTQAMQLLAVRDEWYLEFLNSLDNKDAMEALQGKWIVEMCELANVRKSERAHVRGYLTAKTDRIRLAYGRRSQDLRRSNVFCATVNEFDYQNDPMGDRRKWPVECGDIDLKALEGTRDQLWAETMVRYQSGEKWYLSDAMEKEANRQQAKHYAAGAFDQAIEEFLQRPVPRTITGANGTFALEPFDSSLERVTLRDCLLHGVGFNSVADYGQRELDLARDYLRYRRWLGPKQIWIRGKGNTKFYYRPQEEIDEALNHKMGEEE
jgi:hypothetical protein